MNQNPLDSLLDEIADRVAARILERQQAGAAGMIGQEASPLGRRRHCAAVRRRVSAGQPGAAIVGRRCLLSDEALTEELGGASAKRALPAESKSDAPTTKSTVRDSIDRELRLIRGAR